MSHHPFIIGLVIANFVFWIGAGIVRPRWFDVRPQASHWDDGPLGNAFFFAILFSVLIAVGV